MQGSVNSYRDLLVWQATIELTVACYDATSNFPSSEVYGMSSQMRRAATSIAANIAEGNGRENTGYYIQFLRVAQGSLKELETHVIIAEKVRLLSAQNAADLLGRAEEIGKMLRSLIRTLQRRP